MLVAAGAEDGDGEIGYDAYVQAMTAKLFTGLSRQRGPSEGKANTDGGLLSFDTQVNEYKRCSPCNYVCCTWPARRYMAIYICYVTQYRMYALACMLLRIIVPLASEMALSSCSHRVCEARESRQVN